MFPAKKDLDKHSTVSFIWVKNKERLVFKGRVKGSINFG